MADMSWLDPATQNELKALASSLKKDAGFKPEANQQQDILPFLLMGNQNSSPQMSFAQPLDQNMSSMAPAYSAALPQQSAPESQALTPPPPTPPATQQDMSAAAVGQPYSSNTIDELNKAYQTQQQQQEEAIRLAEEQLKSARLGPQKMDLSPLIALAQSWSLNPSNLLSAYQKPEDKAKTVQALQEAVLKARGGSAELAARRAKDVATLQETEANRKQRLEELALKRKELGITQEERAKAKDESKLLAVRKDYNKEFGNTISGLSQVMNAAERIKSIIKESGGIPSDPSDPLRAEYVSAVSDLTTGFNRDVAKLGALAGGDLELLNAATANSTSVMDAYIRNLFGKGSVQGTTRVIDEILSRGDRTMNEYQQRVKDTYLGYANESFNNQRTLFNQAKEQGRKRKQIQFGSPESEQSSESSIQDLSGMTREQLIEAANKKKAAEGK